MEIHETIAECMIFANHWVAKKIAEAFPNSALVSYCIDRGGRGEGGGGRGVSTHARGDTR